MRFHIENMTCGACVRGVTHAVRTVDPDATVDADLGSRHVEIASSARPEAVAEAIRKAGFEAAPR